MQYNFSPFKKKCSEVEVWLQKELSSIRTSRAAPSILDGILVEAYGSKMPISQVGSIATEGPRSIRVTPWDMSMAKSVEKAINDSKLGLSVSMDEKGIRINFPELTSDRRTELVKLAKQRLEDSRVSLRKERDRTWEEIQAAEEKGGMGEDEKFRFKKEMEKIAEETGKKLEDILKRKEQEIMS